MAIVSAETFVQVRAAAQLVCVEHVRNRGIYDLAEEQGDDDRSSPCSAGIAGYRGRDIEAAFASAPVTLDENVTTPDHSHAMMQPCGTITTWRDDNPTLWTSFQLVSWGADIMNVRFC